jgi:hypothetical protein
VIWAEEDLIEFDPARCEARRIFIWGWKPISISSCPALCRASTSLLRLCVKDVDGQDEARP